LQHVSYSITSSARASSVGGTTTPIAAAVLALMTSSIFVGRTVFDHIRSFVPQAA